MSRNSWKIPETAIIFHLDVVISLSDIWFVDKWRPTILPHIIDNLPWRSCDQPIFCCCWIACCVAESYSGKGVPSQPGHISSMRWININWDTWGGVYQLFSRNDLSPLNHVSLMILRLWHWQCRRWKWVSTTIILDGHLSRSDGTVLNFYWRCSLSAVGNHRKMYLRIRLWSAGENDKRDLPWTCHQIWSGVL